MINIYKSTHVSTVQVTHVHTLESLPIILTVSVPWFGLVEEKLIRYVYFGPST